MTSESKAATAVTSPWDEATLLINGNKVEGNAKVVLLREQVNVVTVEAPPAIARKLRLVQVNDDDLNIAASPDFGRWVPADNGKFEWRLTPGAGKSGRITLVFFSLEETKSWEHPSLVISSNLADEVDVKIDGKEASDAEVVYLRNAKHRITLDPKLNSPLAGCPLILHWIRGDGVLPVDLTFQPQLEAETVVHSWEVTGSATEAGTFELGIVGAGFNASMTLPFSRQINVKYFLDGKEFSIFKEVVSGRPYHFDVEVLGGISRVHVENSPGQLNFNPSLNRWFDLSSGGLVWQFNTDVNDFASETVRFNFSSVYFARDTISFDIVPT